MRAAQLPGSGETGPTSSRTSRLVDVLSKRVGFLDGVLENAQNPHTDAPNRDPDPPAVGREHHRVGTQPGRTPHKDALTEIVMHQLDAGIEGTEGAVTLVAPVVQLAEERGPKSRRDLRGL